METTLSQRLGQFINKTQLSNKEIAELIGCSKQELSNWLHGTKIGLNRIIRISELWPDLNLGWLITGKGEMFEKEIEVENEIDELKGINVTDLYKELHMQQKMIIKLQEEKIAWLNSKEKKE